MAYTLKAVTIRTNNSEEGIRKIDNFFEDMEKEVEKGLYKKYEAVDENGSVELCTKKAWENVWNDSHSGVLKRAFTIDYESSVPAEFSKDGKAHCYLYIAVK